MGQSLSSSKAKEAAPTPPPTEGKFGVRVRLATPTATREPQARSLPFHAAADDAGADREHGRGERRPGRRTGRRRRRHPEPRGAQRAAPARLQGRSAPRWKPRPVWPGCQRGPSGRLAEAGRSSGRPPASASLDQSATWATLAPRPHRPCSPHTVHHTGSSPPSTRRACCSTSSRGSHPRTAAASSRMTVARSIGNGLGASTFGFRESLRGARTECANCRAPL